MVLDQNHYCAVMTTTLILLQWIYRKKDRKRKKDDCVIKLHTLIKWLILE